MPAPPLAMSPETDSVAAARESGLAGPADPQCPFSRVNKSLDALAQLVQFGASDDRGRWDKHINALCASFRDIQDTHEEVVARSDALAHAQADALVRSAEMIDELERTRSQLSEARRVAERQSEERLRLLAGIFNNSQEGVAILNTEAVVQEANPVFLGIVGLREDEVVGHPLAAILDWRSPEFRDVISNITDGQAWAGKVAVARRPGEERIYRVSLSPIHREGQRPSIIVLFSDLTDIDRTQRRLKRQAMHDQLTGLPNRRFFRKRIASLAEDARRDRSSFAVCFLDMDDFKHINDSLGHAAGDALLKIAARRLRDRLSEDVFIARFGGDEFSILIPRIDEDLKKTARVMDAVVRTLRKPFLLSGAQASVGVSVGITYFPKDSSCPDELLQNADVAMYAAKNSGKNHIRSFNPEMRQEVEQRHAIQNQLQQALRGNEISLEYQPKIDLQSGDAIGCEALARWRTSDGRNISPAEFVPIAEQTGLIVPLGELVLYSACRQAAAWHSVGCSPVHIAVNISPHQLHQPNFVERVGEILQETGARPEWFELEITENAVMSDVEHATQTMDQLVAMGLQLAIDDFGTGHSSLSDLKDFNIHTLKIDRSFVTDLPQDSRATAIVRSIIHLGQGRDLTVVAEGIETAAQYEMLREMKCDIGQGYHFSHPLKPEAYEQWAVMAQV